jgi:hypothetical protein
LGFYLQAKLLLPEYDQYVRTAFACYGLFTHV